MIRHMFAGGGTPVGFVNFFDSILPLEKATRRYFLKGASGSGKGTFMKRIAAGFDAAGLDAEHFHCANDVSSLDAVLVPEKGLCIYDATAPHSRDPELPAAIDKLIDFAAFLDDRLIERHVDELKMLLSCKRQLNEKANGYFAAAGRVYTAERAACEATLRMPELRELTRECLELLPVCSDVARIGADRKLFCRAVTPDGLVSFVDTVLDGCTIYGLYATAGAGTDILLSELRDQAHRRGYVTESFYTPFDPSKIECLLLPQGKTAFLVDDSFQRYTDKTKIDEKIELSQCFDPERLSVAQDDSTRGKELFQGLLAQTIELMKASRELHDKIEEIYISGMDFSRVDAMTEGVMGELRLSG